MKKLPALLALFSIALLLAGCVSQGTAPSSSSAPPVLSAATATPAPSPRASCTDGDAGRNYGVRAFVKTVDEQGNSRVYEDYCTGGSQLVEYYCQGNQVAAETRECNCVQGTCGGQVVASLNFSFVGSPSKAFITPCDAPQIVLDVRGAPKNASARFFASWPAKLSGSFNPEAAIAGAEGFVETRMTVSAGCATNGTATANFTAQVCSDAGCLNRTLAIPFTAGTCLNGQANCIANNESLG